MPRPLVAAAALMALAAGSACEPICTEIGTEIGCASEIEIQLTGEHGGELSDRLTYEIVLYLDDAPFSTTCGYPDADLFCDEVEGDAAYAVFISDSGNIASLQFDTSADQPAPEEVRVEIYSGDALVVEQTRTLVYDDDEINGEGCGSCRTARESFTIAAPSA